MMRGMETRLTHAVFALTSLIGAFLLFLVQPLMGKQLLPWFGGSAATWSTCLLFFQAGLVGGYAYAHVTRRLTIRTQAIVHIALLGVSLALAPVVLPASFKPVDVSAPAGHVLAVLTYGIGLPYALLSATAPLLQDWYARSSAGSRPYRLYVPSNVGSLAALLSYPFVVEPWLTVDEQGLGWKWALFGFMVLCGVCAWLGLASTQRANTQAPPPRLGVPLPAATDQLLWVALAAVGSALLMATTNQISQDVAVVPMLWVVPLALYLVTFIVCFADWYRRPMWLGLYLASGVWAAWILARGNSAPLALQSLSLLGLLTAGCMVAHGELVRLRPHPAHLTRFYVAMALGGSIGGALVALVAPVVFASLVELQLVALLIPILLIVTAVRDQAVRTGRHLPAAAWSLPFTLFTVVLGYQLRSSGSSGSTVAVDRDFYGVVRVIQDRDGPRPQRGMLHGRILHGAEFVSPELRSRIVWYYASGSGVAQAFAGHPRRQAGLPMKVGVIGLGAGTLAALTRPGDHIRFFELSPMVISFAQRYFSYLRDSPGQVDVVAGDGRLSLEREMADVGSRGTYDLFVVDAFSGDSIPVHLLTRESIRLYAEALAPDGVMTFHISNRHVDLAPVVHALGEEVGWHVTEVLQRADLAEGVRESRWLIATRQADFTRDMANLAPAAVDSRVVWTDNFSPLLPIVRW